ncbi:MAG: putative transposase YbfD/YdcC [Gammaproteobacteria bacterium]
MTATRDGSVTHSTEKRHFISARSSDVASVSKAVRGHWGIENSLHWVLDVTYREDESIIRRGYGAEVLSVLRRLTLNLLKQNITSKASLKRTRKIVGVSNILCNWIYKITLSSNMMTN